MQARTQARRERAAAAAAAAPAPSDRRGAGVPAFDEAPFYGCAAEVARSAERARAALLEEEACPGADRDEGFLGGAFARERGRQAQAPVRPGLAAPRGGRGAARQQEVWLGPAREDAARPGAR